MPAKSWAKLSKDCSVESYGRTLLRICSQTWEKGKALVINGNGPRNDQTDHRAVQRQCAGLGAPSRQGCISAQHDLQLELAMQPRDRPIGRCHKRGRTADQGREPSRASHQSSLRWRPPPNASLGWQSRQCYLPTRGLPLVAFRHAACRACREHAGQPARCSGSTSLGNGPQPWHGRLPAHITVNRAAFAALMPQNGSCITVPRQWSAGQNPPASWCQVVDCLAGQTAAYKAALSSHYSLSLPASARQPSQPPRALPA